MAALTANKSRRIGVDHAPPTTHPIADGSSTAVEIFAGSAIQIEETTGFCDVLASGTGRHFAGFAVEYKNHTGGAGADFLQVIPAGVLRLANTGITGADPEDVGDPVYMTTDNDFTMSSTSNAVKIGSLRMVDETEGVAEIQFQAKGSQGFSAS